MAQREKTERTKIRAKRKTNQYRKRKIKTTAESEFGNRTELKRPAKTICRAFAFNEILKAIIFRT